MNRNNDQQPMTLTDAVLLCAALTFTLLAMTACENTYKGMGHDLNVEEMKDGWD